MRDLNVTSLPRYRIAASLFVPALVAVIMSGAGPSEQAAFAQGHAQPPPSSGPGPMSRPGMGPGMGPGLGPQRPIPGQADPAGVGPVQELKINPVKLPDNFSPPPTKHEIMDLDEPPVPKDELEKLKKDLSKYQSVLRNAKSSDADKVLLRLWLRYRLGVMCLRENRSNLAKLHEEFLKELTNIVASVPELKGTQVKDFRQIVLQELLIQATPLLTTQNFYVRLHIALLIGELNLTEENSKLGLKLDAFTPGLDTLIKVIADDKQPDAIKVVAVNGIVRLLRLGNAPFNVRTSVAEVLVSELVKKRGHSWYQMRLAGAMAAVDVNLDQARKPFVVDALMAVLADDERTWSVRAESARSLGRVPLPGSVNPTTVTRAVAAFALKLAKAAQQAPPQNANDPRWKGEFIRVYLAFQPLNAEDLMADKKTKAGLLNNAQAAAKPAYDLIISLVVAILHGQRLTVQQVQTLEAWVSPSPPGAQPAQSANQPKTTQEDSKLAEPMTAGAGRK